MTTVDYFWLFVMAVSLSTLGYLLGEHVCEQKNVAVIRAEETQSLLTQDECLDLINRAMQWEDEPESDFPNVIAGQSFINSEGWGVEIYGK